MTTRRHGYVAIPLLALVLTLAGLSGLAQADTAREIDRASREALTELYRSTPTARALGDRARAVLVFPSIVRGGFLFGAQYGTGTLFRRGRTVGYYNTTGASYGFQAGIEKYGYALFFMTDSALRYLDETKGFDLGAGPSLVVVDQGFAAKFSVASATSDVYAMVFGQQGLMGGISFQGTKITRIHPD